MGDIVSAHDESLPRTKWRMGVTHELIKGVDKKKRGAVFRIADKGNGSHLRRPLQRLFPFEILADVRKAPESVTEDVTSVKEENPEPWLAQLVEPVCSAGGRGFEPQTEEKLLPL